MISSRQPLVQPDLLEILTCPACGTGPLRLTPPEAPTPELACPSCRATYGFANGIPLLYKDDFAWAPKQRESQGWVEMWKSIGLYDQDLPISVELPFGSTTEPWITIERMFRAALFQMDLRGGERVLDIGAGEGWAAQHFAQRGANAVAIDVVPDAKLGLGRAWGRMALTETSFDLLIGDNENLPLARDSFDIVFASNALHHHDNLGALFDSIFRVLKPGGRLITIGDPLAPIYLREHDVTDGDREKSFGIIERRRHLHEYVLAVWRAGFHGIHVEDDKTFWKRNGELYPWMDRERARFEGHATLGSTRLTRLLAWTMLRLPRPLAVVLMLYLREDPILLLSCTKPQPEPRRHPR
ncbi:MAG: methyltransferase domain-containing protein [Chloroflexales bacterium]|nr:methyltransferase domain-containing protein [Chloroflexales bacterium]